MCPATQRSVTAAIRQPRPQPGPLSGRVADPDSQEGGGLQLALLDSPLGALVAVADHVRVHLLNFAGDRDLETNRVEASHALGLPVASGNNRVLQRLRDELNQYFQGKRRRFEVPFFTRGTEFQRRVWAELQRIPYGQTASYKDIAIAAENRAAVRAVGRANATNRLCLLIPCHRVIAQDGTLGGYGGGLWRKRFLLELERTGTAPTPQNGSGQ